DRESLRESELALRRANEAKDTFLAAASHELRTPLAAAKAQAQLALRRLSKTEDQDSGPSRALAVIANQIDRMAKLVEDLLDVSRLETGRLSLDLASFDLVPLLRESCERLQMLSTAHEIALVAPPELMIVADRGRVDQVVTNLLSNALRYSPKGGPVWVRA